MNLPHVTGPSVPRHPDALPEAVHLLTGRVVDTGGWARVGVLYTNPRSFVLPGDHLEYEVLPGRHRQHRRPLPLEGQVGELVVRRRVQRVGLDQELNLLTAATFREDILPGHSH